jgi:short-subunit dehydrogenase
MVFMSPTAVVATSLRALGRRVTVVPGLLNKLTVVSMKLSPRRLAAWLLGAIMRRFSASH